MKVSGSALDLSSLSEQVRLQRLLRFPGLCAKRPTNQLAWEALQSFHRPASHLTLLSGGRRKPAESIEVIGDK